jgi:flagellar P-ring protein precursor FlgI
MARPVFAASSRLLLKEPDLGTATRIAAAVNTALGAGAASVEDPGSVALTLPADPAQRMTALSRVEELRVQALRNTRIIIDGRDGTVVAGGDLTIGEAMVSHGAVTLTVGTPTGAAGPGEVRVPGGTSAQQIASALHALQTPPTEIAAIFESLREVGALAAEVTIR